MSIETAVYEDGQWTTRSVNIHDILARAQQGEGSRVNQAGPQPADTAPVLGILARTAIRSPVISRIIPGRVRHKDKNDVVFIGEDFLHINEICADGHLRHVGTKSDFRSRIRAARAFGEPRVPILDVKEAMETKNSSKMDNYDAMDVDQPIAIPPQVLVLTLESNELMFLFAHDEPNGTTTFTHSAIPLPAQNTFLEQPGKHVAVDPLSRAIAVGACENTLIIYSTKSMKTVRHDFAADSTTWTPIREERPVRIEGVILHIEFLYPALDDENHVILLVLYALKGKTRMNCYDWDNSKGLRSAQIRVDKQPLSREERHPLLLIPLQYSSDFMVVTKHDVYLYKDILSGTAEKTVVSITQDDPPRYPGNSQRPPLWTHWCRMARNFRLKGNKEENFYLIREDGVVNYIRINPLQGATATSAAHFNCSVDTAFASLDVGWSLDVPDVLVAAGDMCNGELCKIGAWNHERHIGRTRQEIMDAVHIESIPNWAPTMDMMISQRFDLTDDAVHRREVIYTTSGRSPFGAISELRWGVQARLGLAIDEQELNDVTGIWALHDATEEGVFFLISFPLQSVLIRIPSDTSDVQLNFGEVPCGIDLEEQTLAAASLLPRWAVQVTQRAIYVLDSASREGVLKRAATLELPSERRIVTAAICVSQSIVLTAIRSRSSVEVQLTRLRTEGDKVQLAESGQPYLMDSDPTCLTVLDMQGVPLVCLGTTDSRVLLFRIEPSSGLTLSKAYQLNLQATQDPACVCDSVVLLSNITHEEHAIVCGMRNGSLHTIAIESPVHSSNSKEGEHLHIANGIRTTPMGYTGARVFPSTLGGDIAFAICGSETCRLAYGGRRLGLSIHNIWFTDRDQPAYEQSALSALCQIPQEYQLPGSLVCISGSRFMIAQLDEHVEAIPRRIPMEETPYKLIYSDTLRMMITATVRTKALSPGYREVRSIIYFLHPEEQKTEAADKRVAGRYKLSHGERVYAMAEWTYEDAAGRKYVFLIIGTAAAKENGPQTGRLLFLRIKRDQGELRIEEAKLREFDAPVYSVATDGDRRLVFTMGKAVYVEEFNPENRRWPRLCDYRLSSAGHYISVSLPFVYVSTSEDSLVTLKLSETYHTNPDGTETSHYELIPFCSDGQARQLLYHLAITLPAHTASAEASEVDVSAKGRLILATDKASSLVGLLQPTTRMHHSAAPIIFTAHLSRSVTRLHRGSIRPSWRISHPAGVLVDDIIGTSADGAVFAFTILEAAAWRLLKFIENLMRGRGLLEPSLPTSSSPPLTAGRAKKLRLRDVEPERDVTGVQCGTVYHVDGDNFGMLVDCGGESVLVQLLREAEEEVRVRFADLAKQVLREAKWAREEDMVEETYQWIRDVMRSVF